MSFSLHLESLDRIAENAGDAGAVIRDLDRYVASVPFDPNDEASIARAVAQAEDEIDRRVLALGSDDAVKAIAAQFKTAAGDSIRRRAEASRRQARS